MAIPINPFKYQRPNGEKLFIQDQDKAIRNIFKNEIKGNTLIRLRHRIEKNLGVDNLRKFYPATLTLENSLSGNAELWETEICKHIIGLHKSNTLFYDKEERQRQLNSIEYEDKLINEVIEHIKLRQFGSSFFRQKQLIEGDRFLYFHTPYNLFVMCTRMENLLAFANPETTPYYPLLAKISNMGLSVLSLLEDNFVDNAYPLCRGIIELFCTLLILSVNHDVIDKYSILTQIETQKSRNQQDFPQEFFEMFENRLNQEEKAKERFLHFGWVDEIPNYHDIVKRDPYSIHGIVKYLKSRKEFKEMNLNIYTDFYKKCNSYTHANIMTSAPLIGYFDISIMLYYTIKLVYEFVCDTLQTPSHINGVNILEKTNNDFQLLVSQHNQRSIENINKYYSQN